MDQTLRLTVELPADIVDHLREAVETGEVSSPDQAVAEALQAWAERRLIARIGVERLRQHWREGLASGEAQPLDFDQFRARLDSALADAKAHA